MSESSSPDFYLQTRQVLSSSYPELSPADFYRELFPEGSFEMHRPELDGLDRDERLEFYRSLPADQRRPNGIVLEVPPQDSGKGARQWTVTDDLHALDRFTRDEPVFALMAPIGYSGSKRDLAHAYTLYAMAFDLDQPKLSGLLHQSTHHIIPCPTFIVLSGHGVHLYYQFEKPQPMYPRNATALNLFKRHLTRHIWNPYTSRIDQPQYQSVNQGFRLVGGRSKLGKGYPVRAYRCGSPVTIEDLSDFLNDEERADVGHLIELSDDHVSLEQARELWPEWYKRRIEKGEVAKTWHVNRGLYDWWLKKIQTDSNVGHRYFCIMALAVYAVKCDISRDELERDAYGLIPLFDSISPEDNRFTEDDVKAALKAYEDKYATFTRDAISYLTGIKLTPNRRNYRKQDLHLKIARATRDAIHPDGVWRKGNGRPIGSSSFVNNESAIKTTKAALVNDYVFAHPDATASEVAKACGVSRPTAYKYMPKRERKPRGVSVGRSDKRQIVFDWLDSNEDHSLEAVIAGCSVSRPTAKKYLDEWLASHNIGDVVKRTIKDILNGRGGLPLSVLEDAIADLLQNGKAKEPQTVGKLEMTTEPLTDEDRAKGIIRKGRLNF